MNDRSTGQDSGMDAAEIERLAREFDATVEQIHEAIAAVGPDKGEIEMHLKGSRSSSNSDKVHDAGG